MSHHFSLESSDALQPIFLFPHESPWSTLNTEQAWSSWNIKSGHVTFCLKLVKSRVFPLIYVIWPQILLVSSFLIHSPQACAYLPNYSPAPASISNVIFSTETDHSSECHIHPVSWSSHSTLFSVFSNMSSACFSMMPTACCLPFSTRM